MVIQHANQHIKARHTEMITKPVNIAQGLLSVHGPSQMLWEQGGDSAKPSKTSFCPGQGPNSPPCGTIVLVHRRVSPQVPKLVT